MYFSLNKQYIVAVIFSPYVVTLNEKLGRKLTLVLWLVNPIHCCLSPTASKYDLYVTDIVTYIYAHNYVSLKPLRVFWK